MQLEFTAQTPDDPAEARIHRARLVREVAADLTDERVLSAMARVPRHLFVPYVSFGRAYMNEPVPIGHDQTISQPTIVGIMTEALELTGRERVLEIGTGSGYQTAVLSLLASDVFSIELVPELAAEARERLSRLGYRNVDVRQGDGYAGWSEAAPFDRIIVTAAPERVPTVLLDQLSEGGILVVPAGDRGQIQRLLRYRKHDGQLIGEDLGPVRFVPMVKKV